MCYLFIPYKLSQREHEIKKNKTGLKKARNKRVEMYLCRISVCACPIPFQIRNSDIHENF
jgi:hypothetical protein